MNVIEAYRVRPVHIAEFFAVVVHEPGVGFKVLELRDGEWRPSSIRHADLMMPGFEYNEWDIRRIPLDELPSKP
jgi:hypothetical protein